MVHYTRRHFGLFRSMVSRNLVFMTRALNGNKSTSHAGASDEPRPLVSDTTLELGGNVQRVSLPGTSNGRIDAGTTFRCRPEQ